MLRPAALGGLSLDDLDQPEAHRLRVELVGPLGILDRDSHVMKRHGRPPIYLTPYVLSPPGSRRCLRGQGGGGALTAGFGARRQQLAAVDRDRHPGDVPGLVGD